MLLMASQANALRLGPPAHKTARFKRAGESLGLSMNSVRLAKEESERLLRLSSIFEKAVELFEGDVSGAVNWLTTPKRALEGQTPLQYARTEVGAREVENLIGRLEHGVFS